MSSVAKHIDKLIGERECALWLGVKPSTLQTWRSRWSDGPPFYKIGNAVRYDPAEVKAWLETRRAGGE
jgi:predicted DNA-binding transcriptional regulator AlpA